MRRHLGWALASVILVALSGLGGAMAADMAVKARPVAPPVVIYNWSGCYIGGNVGGGWKRNTLSSTTTFLGTPVAFTDFGHRNLAFAASPGFVFTDTVSSHLTVQEALVGVNYKFNWGWGGAPVVARY